MTKELQLRANTPNLTRGELVIVKSREYEEGKITIEELAKEFKLTGEELEFCKLYTSQGILGFPDEAYIAAFKVKIETNKDQVAVRKKASALLNNQPVITMINTLLSAAGCSYENALKQLSFMMNQHFDMKVKFLSTKLRIEMEGKMKKHQTLEVNVNHNTPRLEDMTLEQKRQLREILNPEQPKIIPIRANNPEDIQEEN